MTELKSFLKTIAKDCPAVAEVVKTLGEVAKELSVIVRYSNVSEKLSAANGGANLDGDEQKKLDVLADDMILKALADVDGVAAYLSEERDEAVTLNKNGNIIVASDPLDGSSNIDTNVSIGTIFSVLPSTGGILQPGRNQLASGIFVYGPQTTLLVTFGDGVVAFQLNSDEEFHKMDWQVILPKETNEFAINASNSGQWIPPVPQYIADCLAGANGPRKRDFNMRWIGSLVADSWRIFRRGGIFLYPADTRDQYELGRLRLIYEANPVAMLVTQAGGSAIDGKHDILDITPNFLHQRVPFIFGSVSEVDEFMKYRP